MSVRNAAKWMMSFTCSSFIALSASANDVDTFHYVTQRAQALADAPYQVPEASLPSALKTLNYDAYRQIRFKPERAYWLDESPFSMQLFHSGFLFQTPVTINIIENGERSLLPFSSDDFQYDGDAARLLEHDLAGSGHAGFRLHYPINTDDYPDEFAVFLGASYFRLVGRDQAYGLSTRGLAVDTALASGEEFPEFREFWLYKPGDDAESITLLALMDSPSLSGAYRITLTPGENTAADIEAVLFARADVEKLGIAPLTSMFAFGEASAKRPDDFRPRVHDSDGLLIQTGADEWIWRPLQNPTSVSVSAFIDNAPNGFGLMQRERDFGRYLDLEAHYHRRPSQWVEPLEDWGPGHVELVEIPTPDETHDNIVAYWVAEEPLRAGESRHLHYRTFTLNEQPEANSLGKVVRTRQGSAAVPGETDSPSADQRQFVVDFQGGNLNDISSSDIIELDISVLNGEALLPQVKALPDNGQRATFRLPPNSEPSDIRLRLMVEGEPVTETWNYVWYPDA